MLEPARGSACAARDTTVSRSRWTLLWQRPRVPPPWPPRTRAPCPAWTSAHPQPRTGQRSSSPTVQRRRAGTNPL